MYGRTYSTNTAELLVQQVKCKISWTKYRFKQLKCGALKELNLYFVDASYTLPVKPRVYIRRRSHVEAAPCGSLKILGCKASSAKIQGTNNLVPQFWFRAKNFRLQHGGF